MTAFGRTLRKTLDAVYFGSGMLGALFMIAILSIIMLQMAARWFGFQAPGSTNYAGYCMAASSFFALPYALNHGAHIRVGLLLNNLGRWRHWGEGWCLAVGAGLATYFARYAIKGAYWSYKLNDISQGQDATPIWIPQLAMAFGTILVAVALWDNLIRLIFTGETNFREEALDAAKVE
ncbi:MAG: TRAP transporter small permease [Pseudomonadota bacterium]